MFFGTRFGVPESHPLSRTRTRFHDRGRNVLWTAAEFEPFVTPSGAANGHATIVSVDAVDFVRELKHQDGKDVCLMGGGELARPLFGAGLIDEIDFNIPQ